MDEENMQTLEKQKEQGGLLATYDQESLDDLYAQAGLYRLCGRLLEAEIDLQLLNLLRGDLREPLSAAGLVANSEFFDDASEDVLERMAQEYTGLLVAPGAAMPYASVFETGRLFQEPADRAEKAYRNAGWKFQNQLSGEFPDHIGVMLSFYASQLQSLAEALEKNDEVLAEAVSERLQSFLTEQLGPWAIGWCRLAANAAYEPFYTQLLTLVEQSLWYDLTDRVESKDELKKIIGLNQRQPPKLDYNADFRKASGL